MGTTTTPTPPDLRQSIRQLWVVVGRRQGKQGFAKHMCERKHRGGGQGMRLAWSQALTLASWSAMRGKKHRCKGKNAKKEVAPNLVPGLDLGQPVRDARHEADRALVRAEVEQPRVQVQVRRPLRASGSVLLSAWHSVFFSDLNAKQGAQVPGHPPCGTQANKKSVWATAWAATHRKRNLTACFGAVVLSSGTSHCTLDSINKSACTVQARLTSTARGCCHSLSTTKNHLCISGPAHGGVIYAVDVPIRRPLVKSTGAAGQQALKRQQRLQDRQTFVAQSWWA